MSIWYPFTQMADLADYPILEIVKGDGHYLVAKDGSRYFDGISSLWTNVHGHCHPYLNRKIKEQVDQICHSTLLGLTHNRAEELARKLAKLVPGDLDKVFYSDSGSTAVEIALKQSFQYWKLSGKAGKNKFIKLENSYHGDTLGAVTVGGIPVFHHVFGPLLQNSYTVPCPVIGPANTNNTAEALSALEAILKEHHEEISALIMEPSVLGAGGILTIPKGFLKQAAELVERYDVHLILDEVATGFGRTGYMFACEEEGVVPDFLCLGKGISGGYLPLAATITNSNVFEMFLGQDGGTRTFFHGHTYTGNPLACAAGLASLELFEKEKTLKNVQARSVDMSEVLEPLRSHKHVSSIRQKGLMCGVELVEKRDGLKPFDADQKVGRRIALQARKHGVILRNLGDVIVLMPPLSCTADEVSMLCNALTKSISDVL